MNWQIKEFLFLREGVGSLISRTDDSFRAYLRGQSVEIDVHLAMSCVEQDSVDKYQDDHGNEFVVYRCTIAVVFSQGDFPL